MEQDETRNCSPWRLQKESTGAEPIAIVGMGCRLPGKIYSPSDLWRFLLDGRSAQGPIPPGRWNKDAFFHPRIDHPGTTNQQGGYFLEDNVLAFDNAFFGINNLEAAAMDPQQRNLLEVVYEALEAGGVGLEDASSTNVGCYVANFTADNLIIKAKDPESLTRFDSTGTGMTLLANRISHIFNLTGPSLVLDTACSSSMYALHLACLSLQAQETDGAIVAGTNLILTPEQHLFTSKLGVLSPTGTCHWADSSADGYGRADGVGALYMKRLSDALRDGDPVRSIIRGTALNCNGRTFGITLPSTEGQEAVIRSAYRKAGLTPDGTDYVECHGTGTAVGDPIEIEALSRVFSSDRSEPLLLGSVKTNLGHSEAASGITSIIKSTLILENGIVPPSFGVDHVNPKIKLADWNVEIVRERTPWPNEMMNRARRISVNSFGYGGANAHVILESANSVQPDTNGISSGSPNGVINGHSNGVISSQHTKLQSDVNGTSAPSALGVDSLQILPLSAASSKSLDDLVQRFASLQSSPHVDVVDLAYTLSNRRSNLSARGYWLAREHVFETSLRPETFIACSESESQAGLPIVFLFTGQGAQWPRMGCELYEQNPTFRSSIQDQDEVLKSLEAAPSWTIRDTILVPSSESMIDHPARSQPVCTALQIGLVDLLARCGIVPDVVLGHSSGEIAAAYAAGHLSRREGIAAAYYRGLAVSESTFQGAMMAVAMDENQAQLELDRSGFSESVQVACTNSSESTTLSGAENCIDALLSNFQSRKLFARKLRTNGKAYHSFDMANYSAKYEEYLSEVFKPSAQKAKPSGVRMISTVTGEEILYRRTREPRYWRANLENRVRFRQAVQSLLEGKNYSFVELGPHSTLELPLKQTCISNASVKHATLLYKSALVRGKDSMETTLRLIGHIFMHGHNVDLGEVNLQLRHNDKEHSRRPPRVLTSLPTYPWRHEEILWHESRRSTEHRCREYPDHDLLGTRLPALHTLKWLWRKSLQLKDVPWIEDHKIENSFILPAAGYIAMAIEALQQALRQPLGSKYAVVLQHVQFPSALEIPSDSGQATEIITELTPVKLSQTRNSAFWYEFEINSITDGTQSLHASGQIRYSPGDATPSYKGSFLDIKSPGRKASAAEFYQAMAQQGVRYGSSFKILSAIHGREEGSASASLSLPGTLTNGSQYASDYALHPVLIDGMLQTGIIADAGGDLSSLRSGLPASIGSMTIHRSVPEIGLHVHAKARRAGFKTVHYGVNVVDASNEHLVTIDDVVCSQFRRSNSDPTPNKEASIFSISWRPDISLLEAGAQSSLKSIVATFDMKRMVNCEPDALDDVLTLVDLVMHKYPRCRVLEFGGYSRLLSEALRRIAAFDSPSQRCEAVLEATFSESGSIRLRDVSSPAKHDENTLYLGAGEQDGFDILLFHKASDLQQWIIVLSSSELKPVTKNHWIVCLENSNSVQLPPRMYNKLFIDGSNGLLIARYTPTNIAREIAQDHRYFLIVPDNDLDLANSITGMIRAQIQADITTIPISKITPATLPAGAMVFSCVELEAPFLENMDATQFQSLRYLIEQAASIVWLTGGSSMDRLRPDFALAPAFFRTMKLEYFPTKFAVIAIDIRNENLSCVGVAAWNILNALQKDSSADDEYIMKDGILHVSRIAPNTEHALDYGREFEMVSRNRLGHSKLSIEAPGSFSSIYMQRIVDPCATKLEPMEVEIEVAAVGLNAKDMYALSSRVHTQDSTCSAECAGTVIRLGSEVGDFAVGDRVVVMAPGKFATQEIVPSWACCKLEPSESFVEMATVPIVFSSAIYALRNRANLMHGETILIHSATGGLGQAAIQLAQQIGTEIFATAGSPAKRDFLRERYGIPQSHLLDSRSASFLPGIMKETNGRGVDVVLNSLTGDLLHASWNCCGEFARFIEVGKADILDSGKLDMSVFKCGATFSAFDLADIYHSASRKQHQVWNKLLMESIYHIRDGSFKIIQPLKAFDVADTGDAFRYLANSNRIGKVAVTFDNPDTLVRSLSPPFETCLGREKSYLMLGCLGGIGRSVAQWMVKRGARHLIFISRSGTRNEAAKLLVDELRGAGVLVDVFQGSVSDELTIRTALNAVRFSLGGVIHAAMAAKEGLFSNQTHEEWQQAIEPKVRGTWAVHNAIQDFESNLDFFIMTSSIAGSIGQPGESSYCAVNSFQDAFAQYRRSLGLTATSVALGAVKGIGYLAEHPEQEAILQKAGYNAMSESELLRIMDLAITRAQESGLGDSRSTPSNAHILTGISGQTPDRHIKHLMRDPRCSQLYANMMRQSTQSTSDSTNSVNSSGISADVEKLLSTKNESGLLAAIVPLVAERLAKLVQTPIERIQGDTRMSNIGMDSMLAVEARQSVTLGVDVPIMEFMTNTSTVQSISARVMEGLLAKAKRAEQG